MKLKKLLSLILAAAMAISLFSTFSITALADDETETPTTTAAEKNITLGTAALSGTDVENKIYKYVYYGAYENSPIIWRILTMNGNDGTYYESAPYSPKATPTDPGDGTVYTDDDDTKFIYLSESNAYYKQTTQVPMFLLSEYALRQTAYEDAYDRDDGDGQALSSDWRYSNIWHWCNDTTDNTAFISSSFTDSEKAYFLKTSKANNTQYFNNELKGDTFFFLSYDELNNVGDSIAKLSNANGSAVDWWLRVPGLDDWVNCVWADGAIYLRPVDRWDVGVRPAFNLNSSLVLFTSAAVGGKPLTAADSEGEISENADFSSFTDNDGYKLTMKREYAEDELEFSATLTETITGIVKTLTFNYDNAKTGTNEYISAMISNEDETEVLYYGQLANVTEESQASGTVKLEIPSDIDWGNYKVKLFNEQINGNYKTDFSSDFVTFDLAVKFEGEGSSTKPYLIHNLYELEFFRKMVNNGTSYEGEYIKLANNIDMSTSYGEGEQSWTPIGKGSKSTIDPAFNGTFDGNRFEIRNLYINAEFENSLGLFGCIDSKATIKNLGVTGSVDAESVFRAGGLVGYCTGTITNCYNHCTISATGTSSAIGGIAGINYEGSITNCYNIGKVNGVMSVGGIVGGASPNAEITNCYYLVDTASVGIGFSDNDEAGNAEAKTAEQFASGEVAYALQKGSDTVLDGDAGGGTNKDYVVDIPTIGDTTIGDTIIEGPTVNRPVLEGPQLWGQKIGTDAFPNLGETKVYQDTYNGVTAYRNAIDGFKILLLGADKKSATVVLNEAGTYTIVFADYENKRLANIKTFEVEVSAARAVRVISDEDFALGTGDKVMLWGKYENLTPMCEAYEVK